MATTLPVGAAGSGKVLAGAVSVDLFALSYIKAKILNALTNQQIAPCKIVSSVQKGLEEA